MWLKEEMMRITFDSVEELKTFCRTFRLEGERPDEHPAADQGKVTDESPKQPESATFRVKSPAAALKPGKRSEERAPRKPGGKTLVERIRMAIEGFRKAGKSFSANDVLEKVLAGDGALNSRSILTGISKMMSTEYAGLATRRSKEKAPGLSKSIIRVERLV